MSTDTASIWSAVAASFSAIAAITIVRIQRLNRIDSSKPEIILDGWSRVEDLNGETKRDVLGFNKIINTGKGSALHVHINSGNLSGDFPISVMSTEQVSIIPAGKEISVNSEMDLWWKNVEPQGPTGKYISIEIRIFCWCASGYRHETKYHLFVVELGANQFFGGTQVAPGVTLTSRRTIMHPIWKLKLYQSLSKWPIVGKYVPGNI